MAGLTVLKKGGKIQNIVSSSDFEIFSPEMHTLVPNVSFKQFVVFVVFQKRVMQKTLCVFMLMYLYVFVFTLCLGAM